MIAELKAIQARINALPALAGRKLSAHVGQVPTGTGLPYVSITGPSHSIGDDLSLNGANGTIDTRGGSGVRVKVVGDTVNNVVVWLAAVRGDLSPGEAETPLAVTGRHAVVVWARPEAVYTDRDSTLPTNVHPVVGVEAYDVISQPLPAADDSSSSSGDEDSSPSGDESSSSSG